MKVLVAVEPVASLDEGFELRDGAVDPAAIRWEHDFCALEEALRMAPTELVLAAVGDADLLAYLARGADRAVRVAGRGGDPLRVARCFAEVARREAPDLVLCSDGATGVALGALVAMPVQRVAAGSNTPRHASFRALNEAAAKPVEVIAPPEDIASGARLRRLARPSRVGAEMLGGTPDEIAARIAEIVRERVDEPSPDDLQTRIDTEAPPFVVMPHTAAAMDVAPAIAARADLGFAADVVAIDWPVVRCSAYGGELEAELDFPDKPSTLLLVRHGQEGILLALGRGAAQPEGIARYEALARRMGAELSAARPIVEAGWLPSTALLGQSGRTVRPKVYLAFGISGAVQHVAGVRGAGTIIAVNTDPDAPIFAVADYGVVADAATIAEALERAI